MPNQNANNLHAATGKLASAIDALHVELAKKFTSTGAVVPTQGGQLSWDATDGFRFHSATGSGASAALVTLPSRDLVRLVPYLARLHATLKANDTSRAQLCEEVETACHAVKCLAEHVAEDE